MQSCPPPHLPPLQSSPFLSVIYLLFVRGNNIKTTPLNCFKSLKYSEKHDKNNPFCNETP